ncbi:hypothetical protein AB0D97_15435 [Streptomyces roseus]
MRLVVDGGCRLAPAVTALAGLVASGLMLHPDLSSAVVGFISFINTRT